MNLMDEKEYPEVVTGAFILNKENKLFLMTMPKWNGQWCIPGGHLEVGETIEDCVRREIREEVGITVTDLKFINIGESIFSKEFTKRKHLVFINYLCKTTDTKLTLNEEATEYKWFTKEDLEKIKIKDSLKEALKIISPLITKN